VPISREKEGGRMKERYGAGIKDISFSKTGEKKGSRMIKLVDGIKIVAASPHHRGEGMVRRASQAVTLTACFKNSCLAPSN